MKINSLFQRLIRLKIYWRRNQWWSILCFFRIPIKISTGQGIFKIHPAVSQFIGKQLYVNRAFELDLSTKAIQVCRQLNGSTKGVGKILDIGANIGVISIGMLTRKELAEAICIEPDLANFQQIGVNARLNHLESKVTVLNLALSDHAGSLELERSHLDQGDHRIRMKSLTDLEQNEESLRETVMIRAEKLDTLINEKQVDISGLSVIWLDTQGHEGYIIKGAQQLLQLDVPVVCEVSPYLMLRAGMPTEQYIQIVSQTFKSIWVMSEDKFEEHPIEYIETLISSLGTTGDFTDVIYY